MEEYAAKVRDQEMMKFVVHSFERAKDFRSPYDREKTKVVVNRSDLSGMGELAGLDRPRRPARWQTWWPWAPPSEAGAGDYWDDADRWTAISSPKSASSN